MDNNLIQQRSISELEKIIIDLTSENLNLKKQITSINEKEDILFIDFLHEWLNVHSISIRDVTKYSYLIHIQKHFEPYFRKNKITLNNLTTKDIETYCKFKMEDGLSPNTVRKHFATIRAALNYAFKHRMVEYNVALSAELPPNSKFQCNVLDFDELNYLFNISKSNPIYTPILLASTLGLRRSEVVGLKWSCVDFEKHHIHIKNTYIQCYDGEKQQKYFVPLTKSKSSNRVIFLPPKIEHYLETIKRQQRINMCNVKNYHTDNIDYVCVRNTGELLLPSFISREFCSIMKKSKIEKKIRFHDLRHSCATYLHEELGYDIKEIQMYLGHSDISTTGNIYLHLNTTKNEKIATDINSKIIF